MALKVPKPMKLKAPSTISPKDPIGGIIKVAFGVGIITGVAGFLR